LKLEDEFLMETLEVICRKYLTPIGRFLQMVWMIRFFRALEIVLLTGCKLERGLGLSFDCSGSCLMASDGPSMIRQLKDGEPLSAALSMSDVFPRMALEMVAVGEASGMVPALCRRYADGQESMLEQCSRDALTLMEPILVGLMGLIVGAIILLTLYPIVEVIRSL
jgi:type II secretory pathway component PulF